MPSISSAAAAYTTQFPSLQRPHPPPELRGLTEIGSATSTNNPLLDFFFHVVPDTPHEDLINRLAKAWKHDPLTALKLMCNLRGLGGTGESDKEGFYAAALWLHENHPKTLAANLKAMSEFGYLKDFPEILIRLQRKTLKDARREEKLSVAPLKVRTVKAASVGGGAAAISLRGYRHLIKTKYSYGAGMYYLSGFWESEKRVYVNPNQRKVKGISEKSNNEDLIVVAKPDDEETKRINAVFDAAYSYGMSAWNSNYYTDYDYDCFRDDYCCYDCYREDWCDYVKQRAMRGRRYLGDFLLPEMNLREQLDLSKRKSRKANTPAMSKRALERYANDAAYRYLHDRISDLFAELLISDLKYLNSGEAGKISLASKWCPSLDSSFDKATLLCESIARRIFPRNSNPDYENIEEAHYAYKIRNRLRKEYLVPLRKVLELPEVYVSSTNSERLLHDRVSSFSMKHYRSFFLEHDKEWFNKYLESVKQGETKIAAGALLPHEILASLNHCNHNVTELQWRRMVDDMSKIGILTNCLAICDVSPSMSGKPMDISVALGLSISEMSQQPWKGKLITFSTNPQLQEIKGDDLKSKTEFIKRMKSGKPTDFQKVYDRILKVAIDGNLKEDQMIKRLFVFSDMEFNEASNSRHQQSRKRAVWETDYQVIQKKFRAKGYMNVPEIVFWNLRESSSTPVLSQQKGVQMLSGYSKNLLKLFLEGDIGKLFPIRMMENAISGEEYNQLVVVD